MHRSPTFGRFKRVEIGLWASLSLVSASGCVSGSVKPLQDSTELGAELPKELRDRFEFQGSAGKATSPDRAISSVKVEETQQESKVKNKHKRLKGEKKEAALAQNFEYPKRRPPQEPIWESERLSYNITYLGLKAGELTLEALPIKTMGNRKVYHIKGHATSSALFSMFYRLNDTIETFIDFEGFFSHRFHLVLDETKQARDSLELNDSEKQQTYYWDRLTRRDQPMRETKKYSPIQPFSQDSVSALYFLRTLDLPIGKTFSVPVVSEGNTWEAVCEVIRKEKVGTPMGDIQALVLKPEMKYQGILKKNGDSFLWVTDDERKFPIRLEAKVKIGHVIASLSKVELGIPPTATLEQVPADSKLPKNP
jgi:hypothetical protein